MKTGRRYNRNDTPMAANHPDWLPIIQQARTRRSTRGLPTPPPGIVRVTGSYYTTTRTKRKDGTVRIYVKWCQPGKVTVIGSYLDPNDGSYPVGKIIKRSDGLRVMVTLDADQGLPWPVLVL